MTFNSVAVRVFCCLACFAVSACSLKRMAVGSISGLFASASSVYLSDEDPELIEAALPFNLKTIETLLVSDPTNRELLAQAASGFTLYARAFIEPQADRVEESDYYAAQRIRKRAARMYLRAYRYGRRGLEAAHPGLAEGISREPALWASRLIEDDLDLSVWSAASLGAAIGLSGDDPELTADIAVVGQLLKRAIQLDESYGNGLLHQFMVAYETSAVDGSLERAEEHYQRACALKGGGTPSLWVTRLESITIPNQDRAEFDDLVKKALNHDVNAHIEGRLLEVLAQRRAQWLHDHVDDLIL